MKIYNFTKNSGTSPKVSIVLIDWSCRESPHILDYLSRQTVTRLSYEVIWVEFYGRKFSQIESRLNECKKLNQPPAVDKWVILDIPGSVYYHKHLMYNAGIAASKGEIVVVCDSDALVSPNFVKTIIKAFANNPNIVLYMDQVRNFNKKFYPFNYPSIQEVIGEGAVNFKAGKTTGLLDDYDPWHSRNYGGCVCALRQDVIDIGGADEHVDYLGYICGPYEFAFRLVNAGKKEIWHQKELLYHVWHPGSVGVNDYMGPHDGYNMSAPALNAIRTKRIMPLVENGAIQRLRLNKSIDIDENLFLYAINKDRIKDWEIDEKKQLIFLGRLAHYKGSQDEALGYWRKALEKFPLEKSFLAEMAWAYYHKSNYKEALNIFDEVLTLDENNQSALRGRGWVNYQLGDFKAAICDFAKLLQYPAGLTKKDLQETLRVIGWAYCHTRQFENAIKNFKNILDNKYSDEKIVLQDIFRGLGWTYFHKGDFLTSKINFVKALENIDPAHKELIREVENALKSMPTKENKKAVAGLKLLFYRARYLLKNKLKRYRFLVIIKHKVAHVLKLVKA